MLLVLVNCVAAADGGGWKKQKGMTAFELVSSGYRLVSTSHAFATDKHTEYLYFQKEDSLYRCMNIKPSTGGSKIKCSVLADPGKK